MTVKDTVLFVTDRARVHPGVYSGDRDDSVHYGRAVVDISFPFPRSERDQEFLRKSNSRTARAIRARADSMAQVHVREVTEVPRDEFFHSLPSERPGGDSTARKAPPVLIFVHGFNNTFGDAIERTTLLKTAIDAQTAIAFSWPSRNSLLAYATDLEQSEWAVPDLARLLLSVDSVVPRGRLEVIAHSMGSRALTLALRLDDEWHEHASGDSSWPRTPWRSLILVDPDYDRQLFFRDAMPVLLQNVPHITVYGTHRDVALAVSRFLRTGYPRVGQVTSNVACPTELDCIDISATLPLVGLNHFEILRPGSPVIRDLRYAARGADLPCRAAIGIFDRETALNVWRLSANPGVHQRQLDGACSAALGQPGDSLEIQMPYPADVAIEGAGLAMTELGYPPCPTAQRPDNLIGWGDATRSQNVRVAARSIRVDSAHAVVVWTAAWVQNPAKDRCSDHSRGVRIVNSEQFSREWRHLQAIAERARSDAGLF